MTEARCPLVREIEHMARSTHHGSVTRLNDIISARGIINNPRWPRLRAALEAAEEMAENIGKVTDSPGLWMAAKRYRAATRTEE